MYSGVVFELGAATFELGDRWLRQTAIVQLLAATSYVALFAVFSLIGDHEDGARTVGHVLVLGGFTVVVTVVRDSFAILRRPIPRATIVRSRA